MFILYILECMLLILLESNSAGAGSVLISTQEPMSINDVVVGYVGWVILAVLIFGAILFIKYLKNRTKLKKKREEQKNNNKKERVFTKKDIKGWLFLFGISLLVLVIGIILSLFAGNELVKIVGTGLRGIGFIITANSVLIPLFKYLWRRLDV